MRLFDKRNPTFSEIASSNYLQHPRYRNCIGHWIQAEGGGTRVHDISGWKNHATAETFPGGSPSWQPSNFGVALDFTRNNEKIRIPNQSRYFKMTALTISTWAKYDGSGGSDEYNILDAWPGGGDLNYLLRFDPPTTSLEFFTYTTATASIVGTSDTNLANAGWCHIAAVYNGSTMYLYLNGVRSTTTASQSGAIGQHANPPTDLLIGGQLAANNDEWDGLIEETRLYNVALPDSAIASLCAQPFLEFEPRPIVGRVPDVVGAPPVRILGGGLIGAVA